MSTNGLTLVGFVADQNRALIHLKFDCAPAAGTTDAALIGDWQTAQAAIGAPTPRAGNPNIRNIPNTHQAYLQQPLLVEFLTNNPGASFKLVEIAPLLAFQLTVDADHSQTHCRAFSNPPTLDELLNVCLPTGPQQIPPSHNWASNNHFVLKSRSLNVRLGNKGLFNVFTVVTKPDGSEVAGPKISIAGAQLILALPFVRVVRFNSRYYLSNGYHRVYGALSRGATEVPCVVLDVNTALDVGIQPNALLDEQRFQAPNPPTVAHFAQPVALQVKLRQTSHVINVNWNTTVVFDEY